MLLKSLIFSIVIAIASASSAYYGYNPSFVSRRSFESPKSTYVIPRPSYSSPQGSYAAPRASYASPRASYANPRASYAAPKESYAEPSWKPHPYNFGYNVDDGYGNNNYHNEEGDEYGAKRGSYGYTDANGLYRKVEYVADENGYRATITTNEPGTANANPADVKIYAKEPPASVYASAGTGVYPAAAYASAPIADYVAPRPYTLPYRRSLKPHKRYY